MWLKRLFQKCKDQKVTPWEITVEDRRVNVILRKSKFKSEEVEELIWQVTGVQRDQILEQVNHRTRPNELVQIWIVREWPN